MTASDRWGKPVVRIAFLFCLLSFLLMVQAGYEYKNSKMDELILEEAKEDAHDKAEGALKNISGELNSTSLLAEGIAKDIRSGELNNDSMVTKRILDEMDGNPEIFSVVVAYSPGVHNGNCTLIHCKRNGSDLKVSSTLPYDYANRSEKTAAWYCNPMERRCSGWNSPYFGIADGVYQIDYSAPFYLKEFKNGNEAAGVVCVSHSLEGVREQVGNLDLGNTGYGFILSEEGVIISYPSQEYLFRNSSELEKEDLCLGLINENLCKNVTDRVVNNPGTGQSSWVFYENISSTNWTMGIVLPREEVLLNKEIEQDCSVIKFVLTTFAFLFFLSVLFVSLQRYDDKNLWMLAFVFSFLCVLGMGIIWHLTLNESSLQDRNEDIIVFDRADVETVLQNCDTSPKTPRVPTGVFIQSLEFSTANDVTMTGYIWQNVSGLVNETTFPSFSFPEAKETTIESAYMDEEKGIVGWHFVTTLRQQFNYSRYPFDEEDVWIKFWNNASEESILVPDFDSYENLAPEKLPGLERSIVLEGWEPQKTYFSYRVNSYNTNFGIENFKHTNVSELYYNIDIKRDFKSPFVSDMLPIMVVAALLFVVLAITTKEERKNQFGFNSSGVLAYCASLFFVLIISHASLRNKIPTDSIIYLEYFYLIMYVAILAVSLNSIAFVSHMDIPFIDTKDNLYVRLVYWPVIMGVLLLITLMNFS
jgi:hypothetical protein